MKHLIKGRILEKSPPFCTVQIFVNNQIVKAVLSGSLKQKPRLLLVGDWIEMEFIVRQNVYRIKKLLPRGNFLKRPLIANVETAFVVTSVKEPPIDWILLTKILMWLQKQTRLNPILIFTKKDLLFCQNDHKALLPITWFQKYYHTLIISAFAKEQISPTLLPLMGTTSVFLGRSGVGKTTLLNCLNPSLNQPTQAISAKTGMGKHRTTFVKYFVVQNHLIADSPGFNHFSISDLHVNDLISAFPFFEEWVQNCHFQPCFHWKEPKCDIKKHRKTTPFLAFFWPIWIKLLQEVKMNSP